MTDTRYTLYATIEPPDERSDEWLPDWLERTFTAASDDEAATRAGAIYADWRRNQGASDPQLQAHRPGAPVGRIENVPLPWVGGAR